MAVRFVLSIVGIFAERRIYRILTIKWEAYRGCGMQTLTINGWCTEVVVCKL